MKNLENEIIKWISEVSIDLESNKAIKAINIVLKECGECGVELSVIGNEIYDIDNDNWVDSPEFIFENKLVFNDEFGSKSWEEILGFIRGVLFRNTVLDKDNLVDIEYITISFENGALNKIKMKLEELVDMGGAIVSNMVVEEGYPILVMYREEPNYAEDSGWNFMSGYEEDEYCRDASNFKVYSVNTLVNYNNDILKHLDSGFNTAFERDSEEGEFEEIQDFFNDSDEIEHNHH
ncbi:MAG: DUF2185 domain-containing protein [Clostridium sp.]